MNQLHLFVTEEEKKRTQECPAQKQNLLGLIQRGIDELQATQQADWIKRTHELKFDKRKGSTP